MNSTSLLAGLRRKFLAAALALPMAFAVQGTPASAATAVGLELSLLIDVSGSVDASEFALQKGGYVQAFQSAAVQNAILGSQLGSIAVNFIQWSGASQQVESVGWTLIDSVASANAFAAAIDGAARAFSGQTAPGSAINFAVPLFASNLFDGLRKVIDVSGDGDQNQGASTAGARDAAVANGFTINGLPIGGVGLFNWYTANVIGGPGAFAISVSTFADFAAAIEDKLVKEIIGVPVPAAFALFAVGLVGLALTRRARA